MTASRNLSFLTFRAAARLVAVDWLPARLGEGKQMIRFEETTAGMSVRKRGRAESLKSRILTVRVKYGSVLEEQ